MAIASEKRMRDEAANYTSGDNLHTELTPFILKLRDNHGTTVPMACVVDLWRKVEDMLILNDNDSTGYYAW